MSTPESKGASPWPWRWGWLDADGDVTADDSLHDGLANAMGIYDESGRRHEPGHELDRALIASAPEMAAMLRELEWAGGEAVSRCPACGERPERVRNVYFEQPVPGKPGFVVATGAPRREVTPGGHAPDCPLNALLDRVGR